MSVCMKCFNERGYILRVVLGKVGCSDKDKERD